MDDELQRNQVSSGPAQVDGDGGHVAMGDFMLVLDQDSEFGRQRRQANAW